MQLAVNELGKEKRWRALALTLEGAKKQAAMSVSLQELKVRMDWRLC